MRGSSVLRNSRRCRAWVLWGEGRHPVGKQARQIGAFLTIAIVVAGAGSFASVEATAQHENTVIDLWSAGTATFGVFVPNERPRAPGGPRWPPRTQARAPRARPMAADSAVCVAMYRFAVLFARLGGGQMPGIRYQMSGIRSQLVLL